MKKPQKRYYLIFILLSTLVLFACSDKKHIRDLREYVAQLKQRMAQNPVKPNPELLQPPKPVVFQTSKMNSPFGEAAIPVQVNGAHPLQSYPLTVLRFKGTATEDSHLWAYILAPDNKLYSVKLGDIIGDHYGKIINIQTDRVEVQEQVSEPGKPTTQRIVTLQLKDGS